jgi:hypothetical protein
MTEAIVAADGFVYQRKAIKKWIKEAIESTCYIYMLLLLTEATSSGRSYGRLAPAALLKMALL